MFYYKWIKITLTDVCKGATLKHDKSGYKIYCKGGGGGGATHPPPPPPPATQAARVASAPNKEPNSYIKSGAAKITFVLYVTKLSSLQKMDQYTESGYCRSEI